MSDLKIATRRSRLALAQAQRVVALMSQAEPDIDVSLVEITTTGDRDRTTSVTTLTEVGAFVRAVQQAVLDGEADVGVHSCKDLPVDGPLELAPFFPEREEPWDVLCGHSLESLPVGASVGTGSPRRGAQLQRLRPDVEIRDIRGNVDTRIEKMRSGQYDAVILAEAGLRRLGREDEIEHRFSLAEMVPAPAQAALAAEALVGSPAARLLSSIEDPDTRTGVQSERELLRQTRAGCRSALGALAVVEDRAIRMTAFVEDESGPRSGEAVGPSPEDVARSLRAELGL